METSLSSGWSSSNWWMQVRICLLYYPLPQLSQNLEGRMPGGKSYSALRKSTRAYPAPATEVNENENEPVVRRNIQIENSTREDESSDREDNSIPNENSSLLSTPMNNHVQNSESNQEIAPSQPILNTSSRTKTCVEIRNKDFFPLALALNVLVNIIHFHYDGPYKCYTEVSANTREIWWREFQTKVEWDKQCFYDSVVLKVFKHRASIDIINMLSKARSSCKRPLWMAEDIWTSLLKSWKDPKFLERSATNKRSRDVSTEIGMPAYAGGSIPVTAHKEILSKELKREPTPKETFAKCYTKSDGTCPGKKAAEIVEAYDKLLDEATKLAETTEESPPINLKKIWLDAVGGVKNGLSNLGFEDDAEVGIQTTQYSSSSRAPSLQDITEKIREEMRESNKDVREEITQHNQR